MSEICNNFFCFFDLEVIHVSSGEQIMCMMIGVIFSGFVTDRTDAVNDSILSVFALKHSEAL